jgi:hypothetical protein
VHLLLKTKVDQNYLKVKEGFNEDLFTSLNPPFPPVELKEFGGSEEGDIVHLRLNFIFFKQDWISEITYDRTNKVLKLDNNTSEIVDDITFKSPFKLMDYLLYPVLWLQFAYRKPIYRRLFNR